MMQDPKTLPNWHELSKDEQEQLSKQWGAQQTINSKAPKSALSAEADDTVYPITLAPIQAQDPATGQGYPKGEVPGVDYGTQNFPTPDSKGLHGVEHNSFQPPMTYGANSTTPRPQFDVEKSQEEDRDNNSNQ